jgi:hypothetical protein
VAPGGGVYATEVSWNPVIKVEAAVVPIETGWPAAPVITVEIPWLVIPALPPKPPKRAAAPRAGGGPASPGPLWPAPPPKPRTGSPHPAARALNSNAVDHMSGLVTLSNLFIGFPSSFDPEKHRCNRPTPLPVLIPVCYVNIRC